MTPDGRYFLAGLFGEDGVAMVDLWQPEMGARKILENYGRGQEKLPVFKMPHLRGWSVAQGKAYLPAIGRHEVLVVDVATWKEVGRIPVRGQPVFVMARPDGRQVWVNFACEVRVDLPAAQIRERIRAHNARLAEPELSDAVIIRSPADLDRADIFDNSRAIVARLLAGRV